MKEIKFNGLDQSLFYKKLDCGLEVYFLPYKNKNNYVMQYITKFGSRNNNFIPIDEEEYVLVPDGIAHFLEHKMFEQEDGIDPFTFAARTGTGANACTNYKNTMYYFEGNDGFNENLDYLLDYVNSPYFTDENVEKEKGIIGEEIKLYDDEIDWFLDEEVRKSLFKNDPVRIDIGGSIKSISKIDKDILYRTYNTFYQPSNMFLIISGNFDMDKALEIIENNKSLLNKRTNYKIKEKEFEEPVLVNEKEKSLKFNIVNPKFSYAIKIPVRGVKDIYKFYLYLGLFNSIKFGSSSVFRETLKQKEMFTHFSSGREMMDDFIIYEFDAETNKPLELLNEIKKELKNFNITEEEIERKKKVWISSEVYMIDNFNATASSVMDDIIDFGKVINDKIDIIRSLNLKELKDTITSIDFDNSCYVVVNPKK